MSCHISSCNKKTFDQIEVEKLEFMPEILTYQSQVNNNQQE